MKLEVSQGKNLPADGSMTRPLQAGVNKNGIRRNGFAVTWFEDADKKRYWIPNAWDTTILLSAKVTDIKGSFKDRDKADAIKYIESSKGENEDFDLMVPDVAELTKIEFRWTVRFRDDFSQEKTRVFTQAYYFSEEGTPQAAQDKLEKIRALTKSIEEVING